MSVFLNSNIKHSLIEKVVIPFELMDLNTYINKQRINRYVGNNAKRAETKKCSIIFKSYMNNGMLIFKDDLPIDILFVWYTKNKMKDKDNTSFAKKFILDGMVESGLLKMMVGVN